MTDKHLEAAAAALWDNQEQSYAAEVADYAHHIEPWEKATPRDHEDFRKAAQAAITAYHASLAASAAETCERPILPGLDAVIAQVRSEAPPARLARDMTKRERFAMAAMQGMCAWAGGQDTDYKWFVGADSDLASDARHCVKIADALLTALQEEPE